jgi:hypothetical protein
MRSGEVCTGFWWESLGKETTVGPSHGLEDNIKMDLQELGYGSMDRFELAQDRDSGWHFVNVVMNLWVP